MHIWSAVPVALLMVFALPVLAQSETPMMMTVQPRSGTVGDHFVVEGDYLDDGHVAAVYLTDGKYDFKAVIEDQTKTSISFTLAPHTGAGRYALMVLTQGPHVRYIEEPVKITVESSAEKPGM